MRSRKRNNLKLILVIILLTISLGYALLQSDLTINGTSKISATNWNVYFDNVQVTSGSAALQTGDSIPTINATTLTDIMYTVTLKEPGEFYEFTVDVVNDGTLDAMIGTITNKLNGNEISTTNPLPAYLSYSVTYSDNTPIASNHLLEKNSTETYKVRLAFRTDINPSDLPTGGATNTLSFGISYVQKTNSGIPVPHPVAIYTANIIDNNDQENTTVRIGQTIPAAITQYSSAADAMAALTLANSGTPVPFYLQHFASNGVVTESYVEFVVSSEMANNNPGMTAGTYSLRGAGLTRLYDEINDEYYYEDIPYEANKTVLQTAFGASNCADNTTSYNCSAAGVASNGFVGVYVGDFYCIVSDDGNSNCSGGGGTV